MSKQINNGKRFKNKYVTQVIERRYSHLGEFADPCAYCGGVGQTIDHIPPISFIVDLEEFVWKRFHLYTVSSCHECNCLLGSEILLELDERRDFIRTKLRQRYAKYLRIPNWTHEELESLHPNMREEIRQDLLIKRATEIRLDYYPVSPLKAPSAYKF